MSYVQHPVEGTLRHENPSCILSFDANVQDFMQSPFNLNYSV